MITPRINRAAFRGATNAELSRLLLTIRKRLVTPDGRLDWKAASAAHPHLCAVATVAAAELCAERRRINPPEKTR